MEKKGVMGWEFVGGFGKLLPKFHLSASYNCVYVVRKDHEESQR